MDLRPRRWVATSPDPKVDVDRWLWDHFRFERLPIVSQRVRDNDVPDSIPSGDETDDEEEKIKSSWHHRALLGDEGRVPYCSWDRHAEGEDAHRDDVDDNVVVFTNVGM